MRELVPLAAAVDKAAAKLEKNGRAEGLEATLAEAIRRAQAAPTEDNLARLEAATKAMRRGAPKQGALEHAHQAAHQKFRSALTDVVRGLAA